MLDPYRAPACAVKNYIHQLWRENKGGRATCSVHTMASLDAWKPALISALSQQMLGSMPYLSTTEIYSPVAINKRIHSTGRRSIHPRRRPHRAQVCRKARGQAFEAKRGSQAIEQTRDSEPARRCAGRYALDGGRLTRRMRRGRLSHMPYRIQQTPGTTRLIRTSNPRDGRLG